jgi:hypothetical protein
MFSGKLTFKRSPSSTKGNAMVNNDSATEKLFQNHCGRRGLWREIGDPEIREARFRLTMDIQLALPR